MHWKTEEYRGKEGGRLERRKNRFESVWAQLLSTCEEKRGPASAHRNTVLKQHAGDSHWSLTQEKVQVTTYTVTQIVWDLDIHKKQRTRPNWVLYTDE